MFISLNIISDENNQLLGVAFDGFPIYGPLDANGNRVDEDGLDECHGHDDDAGKMFNNRSAGAYLEVWRSYLLNHSHGMYSCWHHEVFSTSNYHY